MSILRTLDDVHITDSPKPFSLRLRQATVKEEIKYFGQFDFLLKFIDTLQSWLKHDTIGTLHENLHTFLTASVYQLHQSYLSSIVTKVTNISLVTLFISSTVFSLVTKLTNISCFLRLGKRTNIFVAADIT